MANTCFYEIKVTGRKNDVDRIFKVLGPSLGFDFAT